jgi:hypothetical protein
MKIKKRKKTIIFLQEIIINILAYTDIRTQLNYALTNRENFKFITNNHNINLGKIFSIKDFSIDCRIAILKLFNFFTCKNEEHPNNGHAIERVNRDRFLRCVVCNKFDCACMFVHCCYCNDFYCSYSDYIDCGYCGRCKNCEKLDK